MFTNAAVQKSNQQMRDAVRDDVFQKRVNHVCTISYVCYWTIFTLRGGLLAATAAAAGHLMQPEVKSLQTTHFKDII